MHLNRLFFMLFAAFYFGSLQAKTEMCSQEIAVQVLGSGGPELDDGRTSSSYLIWRGEKAEVLLDTGSGSSIQYGLSGAKFQELDVILLSHLHTDHSADLPSFVKGSFFTPRVTDLWVLGPPGNHIVPSTTDFISRLFGDNGAFSYLSDYLKEEQESYLLRSENAVSKDDKEFQKRFPWGNVSGIRVQHGPIPAIAWKVEIDGCSIVYSGDMSNKSKKLGDFSTNADLLVAHLAIPESAGRIAKNLHMAPSEIGDIVKQAKPRSLLLSHFMRRSERALDENLEAIKADYPGPIILAKEQLKLPVASRIPFHR